MSAPDWRGLAEVLELIQEHGAAIPCRSGGFAATAAWTSNDPDEQREAALACRGCPALTLCRDYALTYPREAGVLGGLTEQDRKPKVGRPKKSEGVRTA